MEKQTVLNRRSFLKTSTLGTLGTISAPLFLSNGCTGQDTKTAELKDVAVAEILNKAPDGKPLRAGLVGCGGRGTGAAVNFLEAGNGLQITAIGDVFKDKMETCRKTLNEKGQKLTDDHCFLGFDAYKQVIDSGVDVVLLCTPATFRPMQFEYALQKGKHCFIEKPCAVDPVGARKMLAMGKLATQQNLSVMSGLVHRWEKNCIETYRRVAGGMIGDILSAQISRLGGSVWFRQREKGWDDMTYMLRNWVNFNWLFGDIILDILIHEIDLLSWFMGNKRPLRAEGAGARLRVTTGDVYDFFNVNYLFDNDIRTSCTIRNIHGCDNQNVVMIYGTKGYVNCYKGTIYRPDGTVAWQYPFPKPGDTDQSMAVPNGYVQEHIQFIKSIRTNTPVNDVEQLVQTTLMAIMGRESAYSGKFVTWDQIMASNLKLGPDHYQFGPTPWYNGDIPIAGDSPVML